MAEATLSTNRLRLVGVRISSLIVLAVTFISAISPSVAFAASQSLYSPTAPPAGYLYVTGSNDSGKAHMLNGGVAADIAATTAGDYCNYYNTTAPNSMGYQNNLDQSSFTGFKPDLPFNNWQEGSSNSKSVCQAELGTWGFKIQDPDNGTCTVASHTCGMHHFARLSGSNFPWSNNGTTPAQSLSFAVTTKPKTATVNTGAFGYMCPILKDVTSGDYIEYCFINWQRGGLFPNVQHNDQIGDCASPSYSVDTIFTQFNSSSAWSTQRAGSDNSNIAANGVALPASLTQTASISAQNLVDAITQLRKPAPPNTTPATPHDGAYGCGRTTHSTNPADYQVVGFEDGLEGGGYTALGESLTNEYMTTSTDAMYHDNALTSNKELQSSNYVGSSVGFRLAMQGDGNLCIYDASGVRAVRCINSAYGSSTASLVMQADGNLVLYSDAARTNAVWSSHTNGNPGAYAVMQADGNLAVYKGAQFLWAGF